MLSSVVFEFVQKRSTISGAYDFSTCSVKLGTCEKSRNLLQSLHSRDKSLGLPLTYVKRLEKRLDCLCSCENPEKCEEIVVGDIIIISSSSSDILAAIARRIFILPIQVAAWHYLYVDEYGKPGFAGIPFSRLISSEAVNMPETVYQQYGSIYSGGDKTSTSTAPTGFFLAYPAYIGFFGLIMALFFIASFDFVALYFTRRIRPAILPVVAGMVASTCFSFSISDFFSVIISCGGWATLFLIFIFSLTSKCLRNPL